MPRWARFLSCGFTGLLLSLVTFLYAAEWREGGGAYFWRNLLDYAATPAFWYLVLLFGLLAAAALLLARLMLHLYALPGLLSGLLAGGLIGLCYAALLLAGRASDWGGVLAAAARIGPEVPYFVLPFGLSAAFTTWLWDRLD